MTSRLLIGFITVFFGAFLFWKTLEEAWSSSNIPADAQFTQAEVSTNPEQATPSAQGPDNQSEGPRIFFPETVFDFGTIPEGSEVTHTFIVKNTGDAPLKLIKAKGG